MGCTVCLYSFDSFEGLCFWCLDGYYSFDSFEMGFSGCLDSIDSYDSFERLCYWSLDNFDWGCFKCWDRHDNFDSLRDCAIGVWILFTQGFPGCLESFDSFLIGGILVENHDILDNI